MVIVAAIGCYPDDVEDGSLVC